MDRSVSIFVPGPRRFMGNPETVSLLASVFSIAVSAWWGVVTAKAMDSESMTKGFNGGESIRLIDASPVWRDVNVKLTEDRMLAGYFGVSSLYAIALSLFVIRWLWQLASVVTEDVRLSVFWRDGALRSSTLAVISLVALLALSGASLSHWYGINPYLACTGAGLLTIWTFASVFLLYWKISDEMEEAIRAYRGGEPRWVEDSGD